MINLCSALPDPNQPLPAMSGEPKLSSVPNMPGQAQPGQPMPGNPRTGELAN